MRVVNFAQGDFMMLGMYLTFFYAVAASIDPLIGALLTLPPFFLLMRNLRISWRAKWLAGFLLVVGNWVGQDYFSPQSINYVLYLVFLAILVNWFTDPGLSRGPQDQPGRKGLPDRRALPVRLLRP